jgi:predicted amidohydrolase YtcJ
MMVQGWSARLVAVPYLTVLTLLLVSVATAFGASGPANVVLHNGKIYTADPSRSVGQAIAFTGNTIIAVGTDAEVASLIGPGTVVIDLKGKLVLPGLIDTHIHPIIGAVNGSKCSLARIEATVEAIRPVLQACIQKRSSTSSAFN